MTMTTIPTTPPRATVRAEPAVTYVVLAAGGPYGVLVWPVGSESGAEANGVGVMTGSPLLSYAVDMAYSVDVVTAGKLPSE